MSTYTAFRDGGKSGEEAFSRLLNKIADTNNEGVVGTDNLEVTEIGTPDMSVDIAVGDIVIPYQNHFFHSWVTASENVVITANASGNPRIDAVVAYIDLTEVSSALSNNPDALKFMVIAGTPAGSPSAPLDATIQTAVGASNPFHRLANVAVANGASSIVTANITDTRELFVLGVGISNAQTLSNKIISKLVAINEYDNGNSGASPNINWANGDRQKITLTGNATFTFSNAVEGQVLTLWLVQDGTGGRTVTLPTIKWPGGSAPTFSASANDIDMIVVRYNGSAYFGMFATDFT